MYLKTSACKVSAATNSQKYMYKNFKIAIIINLPLETVCTFI